MCLQNDWPKSIRQQGTLGTYLRDWALWVGHLLACTQPGNLLLTGWRRSWSEPPSCRCWRPPAWDLRHHRSGLEMGDREQIREALTDLCKQTGRWSATIFIYMHIQKRWMIYFTPKSQGPDIGMIRFLKDHQQCINPKSQFQFQHHSVLLLCVLTTDQWLLTT